LVDVGLLTAILFHASVHTDTVRRRSWNESTLYYRGEAIRIINERLKDPEAAISDSSIAMVAFLAASGVSHPL
jgi:hypothetical protein